MDIFQKTALGKFLSTLTEAERQMLFQCYVKDFIVLSIGVSSQEELQVSVWNKSSDSLEGEKSVMPVDVPSCISLAFSDFQD